MSNIKYSSFKHKTTQIGFTIKYKKWEWKRKEIKKQEMELGRGIFCSSLLPTMAWLFELLPADGRHFWYRNPLQLLQGWAEVRVLRLNSSCTVVCKDMQTRFSLFRRQDFNFSQRFQNIYLLSNPIIISLLTRVIWNTHNVSRSFCSFCQYAFWNRVKLSLKKIVC